jgi:hypothetical protein
MNVENFWDRRNWVTKDKETLEVYQMSTTHIINTMKLIEKNAPRYLESTLINMLTLPRPSGEYAGYAFENELDYWMGLSAQRFFRDVIQEGLLWRTFSEELDRRVPIRG